MSIMIVNSVSNESTDPYKRLTIVLKYTSSSKQLLDFITEDGVKVGSIEGTAFKVCENKNLYSYKAFMDVSEPVSIASQINTDFFLDVRQMQEQPNMLRILLHSFEISWKNMVEDYTYGDYHVVPKLDGINDCHLVFKGYKLFGEVSLKLIEEEPGDIFSTSSYYSPQLEFFIGNRKVIRSLEPPYLINKKDEAIKYGVDMLLGYAGETIRKEIKGERFDELSKIAYKHLTEADKAIEEVLVFAGSFLNELRTNIKITVELIKQDIEKQKEPSDKFFKDLTAYSEQLFDFLGFIENSKIKAFVNTNIKKDFGFLLIGILNTLTKSGVIKIDNNILIKKNIDKIRELMS